MWLVTTRIKMIWIDKGCKRADPAIAPCIRAQLSLEPAYTGSCVGCFDRRSGLDDVVQRESMQKAARSRAGSVLSQADAPLRTDHPRRDKTPNAISISLVESTIISFPSHVSPENVHCSLSSLAKYSCPEPSGDGYDTCLA